MTDWKAEKIEKLIDSYKDKTNKEIDYISETELRDRENVLLGMTMIYDLLVGMEEI